jgi:hypothetical protein
MTYLQITPIAHDIHPDKIANNNVELTNERIQKPTAAVNNLFTQEGDEYFTALVQHFEGSAPKK